MNSTNETKMDMKQAKQNNTPNIRWTLVGYDLIVYALVAVILLVLYEYPLAFIAIGDNKIRQKYAELLREYHFLIPSIVSPAANISPGAVLGDGVVILPMARVGEASIGDFSIIASNGVVSSGARVGSFSHIDCGAIVQQRAHVKESTWVRSGEIYGGKL